MSETLVVNEIYLSLQGESTFAGLPCVFVRLTACNLRCSYCDTAYAFTEGTKQTIADVLQKIRQLAAPFSQSDPCGSSSPSPGGPRSAERSSLTGELTRGGLGKPLAGVRGTATSTSQRLPLQQEHSVPVETQKLPLIELTGGEPLLQAASLPLMKTLCDEGFTVLIETSGAHDISAIDPRVRRIMDLKCPGSGEAARNRWENLSHLKSSDEIKFVIGTVEDYEWTKQQITRHNLAAICPLLVSWVQPLTPEQQDKSLKKVPAGQTPISRRDLAERIIADALPVRFQVQMHKVIWPPDERGV